MRLAETRFSEAKDTGLIVGLKSRPVQSAGVL